jgi:hypothetical protein
MIAVVPLGFYSSRIQGDNPVHNFGTIFGRNENDHITLLNYPPIVWNDLKSISRFKSRIHTGAQIVY